MKKLLGISAALLGLLALTGSAHAQTISWASAQNMVGDTDVVANGTYFDAISFYSSALTVNGVTFNPISGGSPATDGKISVDYGDDIGAFGTPFTTTPPSSVAYSNLTDTGAFGAGGFNTVTISGLTINDIYQVQSWSYYTGDSPTATTIYSGTTPVSLLNATGQFAIGTFTATSSSETYEYATSSGHNFVNAISVRDITSDSSVPEPSSTLLLGVGFGVLVIFIRRKRQALIQVAS